MKLDNNTAAVFRSLTERFPEVCGSYDQSTHSMTAFLSVKGVLDFAEWRKQSERVRRIATMQESTVLPGVWSRDPSAPRLIDTPSYAVSYDTKTDLFHPAVNVATVTQVDFYKALSEATAAAAEATLFRERTGRLPGAGDLSQPVIIFYPTATAGMNGDPAIQDLLTRINKAGGANTAAGSASGRGTMQTQRQPQARPQTMQAHDPDRYHRTIRT